MLIGYARVSTDAQNLDRQIAALKEHGCDKIYAEKKSARTMTNRPELDKAIKALAAGNTLVVAEWDRATRSMEDGIKIIARIFEQGATLRALDRASLDLTTPTGRALLGLLSAFAEEERNRIVKRAADGRKAAKKRGTKFGPKPKFPKGTQARAEIEARLANGTESCRHIARSYNCHHSTISAIRDEMD